jgi:hypothetical protein
MKGLIGKMRWRGTCGSIVPLEIGHCRIEIDKCPSFFQRLGIHIRPAGFLNVPLYER